jgi:hypothetical protein
MWCVTRGGAKRTRRVRNTVEVDNESWQGVPAEFFVVLLIHYYRVMSNWASRLRI